MRLCLRRREFIAGLGGAVAWPLAVSAQQRPMPVVGLLQIGSSWDFTGFRQGLKETGYVEGQNLVIEYRWANDDPNRLPELAADLTRRPVHVIVAFASRSSVDAAKPRRIPFRSFLVMGATRFNGVTLPASIGQAGM